MDVIEQRVQEMLPLVLHIAKRLFPAQGKDTRVHRAGGWEEVLQEGRLALLRAARNFDVSRGIKFITYAHASIWRTLRRFVYYAPGLLRVKRSTKRLQSAYWEEYRKLPRIFCPSSLERAGSLDSSWQREREAVEEFEELHLLLKRLPETWRELLHRHYWEGCSLRSLAEQEGVSHQALRHRREKALYRLLSLYQKRGQ
jgi:RNA polymerase sigma factor (sigma-70 family)